MDRIEVAKKFTKINFLQMDKISLIKFIRRELGIGLAEGFAVADMLQHTYSMGVIRGQCIKLESMKVHSTGDNNA